MLKDDDFDTSTGPSICGLSGGSVKIITCINIVLMQLRSIQMCIIMQI